MATISWGRPSLFQTKPSADGAPAASGEWKDIEIPKEGTLQIISNDGEEQTAKEEGGGLVDVRFNANTYELQFQEYVKKGKASLFEDEDGIVPGEHAFRFLPEDDTCDGRQIDKAIVRVSETFTVADGILRLFKARCLKPKEGKTVKKFTKEQVNA